MTTNEILTYNVNHTPAWLADTCQLMISPEKDERTKGWNDALRRVIRIIEHGMIGGKE